tara:strand:+ start:118 stop:681 length:564 start_codon:yes stop_codon:yes gene_type:complete
MKLYYVYHAIQKDGTPKVGATSQPNIRFKRYNTAVLLEAYDCPKKTGDREIELTNFYGYKQDNHHYVTMLKKRNYSKERNKKVSDGLRKAWADGKRKDRDYSHITEDFLKDKSKKLKKNWSEQYEERKSKQAKGEKVALSILTEEEVLNIRKEFIPFKVTYKVLAKKYNVSMHNINKIVNRKTWKHI